MLPVYDVFFTLSSFKKLEDDSTVKVEKLIGMVTGLVAMNANAAVAVAARRLPATVDPEELAQSLVTPKQQT